MIFCQLQKYKRKFFLQKMNKGNKYNRLFSIMISEYQISIYFFYPGNIYF